MAIHFMQGQRKQFNSGQAISWRGGSEGPPAENFGKMLLAGAFWLDHALLPHPHPHPS